TGRPLMQSPLTFYPGFSSDGRWLGVAQHGEQGRLLEVTPTREYRTLASELGAGINHYGGDISPDGRLLAVGANDGVRLWHLASGRELALLPRPWNPLFQPDGRELLTCPREGLLRWSIQESGKNANELRLGPPRALAPVVAPTAASRSR